MIGNVVLDVGDLIEGGTDEHRRRMDRFYKKYKCGKQLRIKDNRDDGTLVVGRRVVQREDSGFRLSMHDLAEKKIWPIEVPRGYLSQDGQVDDEVLHQGCVGRAQVVGRDYATPPRIGLLSHPGYFADRDKRMVSEVNAALTHAKDLRYDVAIWPIPPSDWRVVAFCHSSTDTSGKQRHQGGYIVGVPNRYFSQGERVPVSMLFWTSAKHTRKASSPQFCETYAASDCAVEVAWAIGVDHVDRLRHRGASETFAPQAAGPAVSAGRAAHLSDPEAIIVSPPKGL